MFYDLRVHCVAPNCKYARCKIVDEEFPLYFMFIVYGKELTQTWARLTSWKTAVSVSAPSATLRHRETWDKRRTWNIVSSHRSPTPAISPTPWCSPTTTTTPGPGKVAVASSLHHTHLFICSFSWIPCNIIPCEPNRNQNLLVGASSPQD